MKFYIQAEVIQINYIKLLKALYKTKDLICIPQIYNNNCFFFAINHSTIQQKLIILHIRLYI